MSESQHKKLKMLRLTSQVSVIFPAALQDEQPGWWSGGEEPEVNTRQETSQLSLLELLLGGDRV